jgi:hypothetical protein
MFKKLKKWWHTRSFAKATGKNKYKVVCMVQLPFPEGTQTIYLTRFCKATNSKDTANTIVKAELEKALKQAVVLPYMTSETIQNQA